MKAEYDFSKGERGKFYRPGAMLNLPVYLDPDVDTFMRQVSLNVTVVQSDAIRRKAA